MGGLDRGEIITGDDVSVVLVISKSDGRSIGRSRIQTRTFVPPPPVIVVVAAAAAAAAAAPASTDIPSLSLLTLLFRITTDSNGAFALDVMTV
jgi:hypothetical protein